MGKADDFIEKFHNLEGILLKERKKSLFLLFNTFKSLRDNDTVLKEIDEKLRPRTFLEEIYKIEFLIHFERAHELFSMLKNGNDMAVNKIMKQTWFLRNIFQELEPHYLVHDIFPQLSVLVRSKLLNQILKQKKDEQFFDNLFNELDETYGLKPSLIIISGCSIAKIEEILKTRSPKISKAQLALLYKKSSSVIELYYQEFFRKGGDLGKLNDFSRFIKKKNPKLYVKLVQKYEDAITGGYYYTSTLGRRTTKAFMKENKKELLENPKKFIKINVLHHKHLVRYLGEDFPAFFRSIFSKKLPDVMDSLLYLNEYPKKKRYELFSTVFEEIFKKKLLDSEVEMRSSLLEVISDVDVREKWVKKYENKVQYLKYKRSSLAVKELKEYFVKSDNIKFRSQLSRYLVECCKINKDNDALLDVLRFFCKRCRNTDGGVGALFMEAIYNHIELDDLNEEHWNLIYELMQVQDIRNLYKNLSMVFEYCRFLYKSGKSFEPVIPLFLRSDNFQMTGLRFKKNNFRDENFQKLLLELVLKYFHNVKETDNGQIATEIILAIRNWNKKHPTQKITIAKEKQLVEAIKRIVNVEYIYYQSDELKAMEYLIYQEDLFNEFEDIFFNHTQVMHYLNTPNWLLNHKPFIYEGKIDKIIDFVDRAPKNIKLRTLKKYSHLPFFAKIIERYSEELKNPTEMEKEKISQLLGSIMPNNDYLKLIENYQPKLDRLDLMKANDEEKSLMQLQIALIKSVRFTTCQVEALTCVLEYCKGDYFQPALKSLYSCLIRLPEVRLKEVLDLLLQKPVSVKKHAIFVTALAFPIKNYEELGQKILDSEKNESILKHLFTSTYKFFLKNPSDQIWIPLQKYMNHNIEITEQESLDLLTNINVIPETYKNVFAQKVFELFEEIEQKDIKPMNEFYDKFMKNTRENDVAYLSPELCNKIIEKRFFDADQNKGNDICMQFAINYMMYGKDMEKNIQNVMRIMSDFKVAYWDSAERCRSFRNSLYNFCKTMFEKVMRKKELRLSLSKSFSEMVLKEWEKIFTRRETFEEVILLNIMVLKYEESKDLSFYASRLIEIFIEIKSLYGDAIIDKFGRVVSSSLNLLLGQKDYTEKLMQLLANMLKLESSTPLCLVIIQLLPSDQNKDEKFLENFNFIMENLNGKSDDIIKIYLNTHLKT